MIANTIGAHHGRNDLDSMGAYVFESRIARNGRGAPSPLVPPLKAQSGQSGQSGKGDGGQHKRPDRPEVGMYVSEAETALTVGTTDLTAVAYNWQSGGDVRHSFGLPSLHSGQTPAVGVRRLTPTECERLQGFPDGWTAELSDSARYKALGNAVAVPVVEWIARRIAAL